MNIDSIRSFALHFSDVEEALPFGPDTLVFKVNSKIFLLLSLDASPLTFNVKCDPDEAVELREEYPESVLPGYHMNKRHWNTIVIDGVLSSQQLQKFISNSYHLVKGKKKL